MKTTMKRLTFILAMLMVLTACGSKPPAEGSSGSGEPSEAPLRAALVSPQKLGDNGVVDFTYASLQKGEKELGYEIKLIECESGEYEESIRAMARDGYNLIFGLFTSMQDAISRVAPEYPDTHFVLMFGDLDMKNVTSINTKVEENCFLNGVVAANISTTKKVAILAGAEVADNLRAVAGFEAGVKAADPAVEVTHMYVGSFEDPTKGKELANVLFNEGYDVIMQWCAASSMGIREAVMEQGDGHYMLGSSLADLGSVPGRVYSSTDTNYDAVIYDSMKKLQDGTLEGGLLWLGLADKFGGVVFADDYDELIQTPPELRTAVSEFEQKIVSGEITVPTDPS
nr:BMP family ABC transporter substrate-binding protein [uncultured Oscillibacter sp.]